MKMQTLTQWATKGNNLLKVFLFVLVAASFSACGGDDNYYAPFDVEGQKKIDEQVIRKYFRDNNVDTTKVVRTESGLYYLELKPGTGAEIKTGNLVEVMYVGKLANNSVFDSSYERGKAFTLTVGARQVITGWDEGLQLMKVGEEARLFIPSHLGYGPYNQGSIPGSSVLIFDIEVLRTK
ncbi:FKBP-type peptidyl-prolyl cis-trans isomerase [uncultured Pontibacter sp.]|uniref:FKBP-type peptidyl-prolyl cis-trans isomerase n=1 Tax=uncultured Pontibacter sp. TaxID=453356 RepID=UPI0026207059|nr:FKBP-type peptidyl-prolyl cis-trans isomerase [uncultured Pontibacter sp.]